MSFGLASDTRGWRCRAGQEERATWLPVINRTADGVPYRREPLPLVDEYWPGRGQGAMHVCFGDAACVRIIESDLGSDALESCRGLSDALRALDGNGRQRSEKRVEILVDCPSSILHGDT
jgi:hypothetical protein